MFPNRFTRAYIKPSFIIQTINYNLDRKWDSKGQVIQKECIQVPFDKSYKEFLIEK